MNPESMNKKAIHLNLDFVGITVSVLCAVHCIALPILFSTLPLWGFEVLENGYIEFASVLLTLVAGGEAIRKGYTRVHRSVSVVVLFLGGVALMTLANFMDGAVVEMMLKGSGALFVIGAHVRNWRRGKAGNAS